MKKLIFGYTSMAITLALAIVIPNFFKLNDYSMALAACIGVFNSVISGAIIIIAHLDLGNIPKL
jgi:hypothetical protein